MVREDSYDKHLQKYNSLTDSRLAGAFRAYRPDSDSDTFQGSAIMDAITERCGSVEGIHKWVFSNSQNNLKKKGNLFEGLYNAAKEELLKTRRTEIIANCKLNHYTPGMGTPYEISYLISDSKVDDSGRFDNSGKTIDDVVEIAKRNLEDTLGFRNSQIMNITPNQKIFVFEL